MRTRIAMAVMLSLSLALLSGTAWAGAKGTKGSKPAAKSPVAAKAGAKTAAHSGSVVSAGKGKLTMTDKGTTKEHSHDVPASAKVTIDGKPAKLEDLKKGATITVTTDSKGAVEAITSP